MMYEAGRASQVLPLLTDPTKRYQEAHSHVNAYRSQGSPQRQTAQTPKHFHPYLWHNALGPASLDSD
jgi:hypothetical protein